MSTGTTAAPDGAGQHQPLKHWSELGLVRRRGVRRWFRRHPRVMNTVVVLIYLLLSAGNLGILFEDLGGLGWVILGINLAVGVALFFRHRAPLVITAAIMVLEAAALYLYPWHNVQLIGLCFALYCVGLARGLKTGLPVAAAAWVFSYLPGLRGRKWEEEHGDPALSQGWDQIGVDVSTEAFLLTTAPMMLLFCGVAVGIGAAVRRGRLHEQEVLEWAERSQRLAQVGERNRIAREMHDVVAHSLSVMISLADGARVVVRRDPERAAEVLEELSGTGRTALADMRRVIGVLKKGEDVSSAREQERGPVRESLDELYDGFRQAGMPLTVTTSGPPLPDDTAFGLTVHRIVQESLTNVLRYGRQVTQVEVRVEHHPGVSREESERLRTEEGLSEQEQEALGIRRTGQVILTVSDDGLLPAGGERRESVGSGQGIHGMGERVAFYNGSIYAGPGHHRGWTVRAVLEPPE